MKSKNRLLKRNNAAFFDVLFYLLALMRWYLSPNIQTQNCFKKFNTKVNSKQAVPIRLLFNTWLHSFIKTCPFFKGEGNDKSDSF